MQKRNIRKAVLASIILYKLPLIPLVSLQERASGLKKTTTLTHQRYAETVAELQSDVLLLTGETTTNIVAESLSNARHSVDAQRRRDVVVVVVVVLVNVLLVVTTTLAGLEDGRQQDVVVTAASAVWRGRTAVDQCRGDYHIELCV